MTVQELIQELQTFPQDLPVIVPLHSEFILLEDVCLQLEAHQPTRPDGWVHSNRPNRPKKQYLVIGA